MDKKRAALNENCFADFDYRSYRLLQAFSCRLLPALLLADSCPKRFGNFLADHHFERSINVSLIFPRRCDQSWFRLAMSSNCGAHRGKSRTHKSESKQ